MFDLLTQIFKGEPLKFIIDSANLAESNYLNDRQESYSAIYDKDGILILSHFINENTAYFNQVVFSFKAGDFNGLVRFEVDGFDTKYVCVELFKDNKPVGEEFFDWFVENGINPLRMNDKEKALMKFNGF